jgi:hypothetical protein
MSSTEQLDRAAVDFLLRAMEAPHLQVTAAALSLHPSSLSDALLKRGYLVPDGYEAVLTSPDLQDRLMPLVWSEDSQGFGYFDAAEGWVKVSHEEVRRYRIDIDRVISSLTSRPGLPSSARRRILVEDLLWDLGTCRFGNRTKVMPILFARRLSQPTSTKLVQRALQTRPLNGVPLLLTSTPSEDLPPFNAAHVISIQDVLEDGLTLDSSRVAASLDRSISARPSDPITLLADGKEVVFFGRSYSFAKGTQQRRILQLLYDHYREGEHSLSVDYVIAELELRPNARIRDFFKKHPAWGIMLFEKGGKCGFVLERT